MDHGYVKLVLVKQKLVCGKSRKLAHQVAIGVYIELGLINVPEVALCCAPMS